MSLDQSGLSSPIRVPFVIQLVAWLFGLAACLAGMINLIAEWNMELATIQFLFLVIAPIIWMIERRRAASVAIERSLQDTEVRAWCFAISVGLTSLGTSYFVGHGMIDLPPAYHDEYSYLFQAKTLMQGAFSMASHPTHPELFNQMHVLNEGRMASRYYPGTGLWLAPFLAMHHPYYAQWLASSLVSIFVFWAGYEIGRLRVAVISGFACALSPGIALFGNLLLAHQPTLLGLSVFIWAFLKWQRTNAAREAFYAGCGLSFAMLCRPATAAGFGLPFGVVFLYWLITAVEDGKAMNWSRRMRIVLAIGLPLFIGWLVMLAYHHRVTGAWRTSPYQLYTDIYSPRHVYGFYNVERGLQKQGPKVIQAYDRWAKNLTPELAAANVCDRWLSSWIWTFDLLPLLLSSIIACGTLFRTDLRWLPIGFAILSLHAIHIPYWYAGIMGWHYVFETSILWCLVLGLATDLLFREWSRLGRWLMPAWWSMLLLLSLAGDYVPPRLLVSTSSEKSRVSRGVASIRYPRQKYEQFDQWLDANVTIRPALVLIEIDLDDTHIDYVVNDPGLSSPILRARFLFGETDLKTIVEAFPDRQVYLCYPGKKIIEPIQKPLVNR